MRRQLHLAAAGGSKTILGGLTLLSLLCGGAHATTTVNTTITINGSGTTSASGVSATGTLTFSGGLTASGTFSATAGLTSLESGNVPVTLTITTGSTTGTLTGTFTASVTLLAEVLLGDSSASGPGTIAITSGTGGLANTTGNFNVTASGTGTGTTSAGSGTFMITGPGTLTIGGGTTGPPPPTITAVLDAASNTANLAQGTIFILKGSALCSVTTLTAYNVPRPTVGKDGVTITFTPTAGGTGTNALLWYEDPLAGGNCQLAGILPSTVAPGSYNVTVTNGTVSAPMQAQVVQSKFALFTQDSTGTGLAAAQDQVSTNYYLNRLTTGSIDGTAIAPAYPGEYIVAYGTGLGGVPAADDNDESPVDDFSKTDTIQAIVGGTAIPVLFAGRAGYAGEDQINFQLPASIATGCAVSFQISVNGTLSPAATLSIAPNASASACVQPGYTSTQLSSLDSGGTITAGGFNIASFTENVASLGNFTFSEVGGGFTQISGFQLGALPFSYSSITSGSCTVIRVSGTAGNLSAPGTVTNLDAGTVTISGPSGSGLSATPLIETDNAYSLEVGSVEGITLPGSVNGSIVAGTYNLNGAGGTSVGSFSSSLTLGSPLTVTGGLPATVTRSQALQLSWTGGNASDTVAIIGYSGSTSGSSTNPTVTATEFICTTTAGAGSFTVPANILSALPATASTANGGTGFLEVGSGPTPATFNATVSGQSVTGTFSSLIATAGSVIYQ
jgi:uncharacterized protein (TIGR03437 family)